MLEMLSRELGRLKVYQISRDTLIAFAKERAKAGAGPVTVSIDLGYIKTVLLHAAAVHGLAVTTEPVDKARFARGTRLRWSRNLRPCSLRNSNGGRLPLLSFT